LFQSQGLKLEARSAESGVGIWGGPATGPGEKQNQQLPSEVQLLLTNSLLVFEKQAYYYLA